jgi:phage terminase small subunit
MSRRPKPHWEIPEAAAPRRRTPRAPAGLGTEGLAAWSYVWKCPWIHPDRHLHAVRRYSHLQDILARAIAAAGADEIIVSGSRGQGRVNPALAEVRLLSAECRLLEVELGLTPAAASKAGATRTRTAPPDGVRDDPRRKGFDDPSDDSDDPRVGLRVIT